MRTFYTGPGPFNVGRVEIPSTSTSTSTPAVESGAEDAGASVLRRTKGESYALRETAARAEDDRNRAAEDEARARRLDRDRLIAAGLYRLEATAIAADSGATALPYDKRIAIYLFGYAGLRDQDPTYVLGLLAEIRAELSPLVCKELIDDCTCGRACACGHVLTAGDRTLGNCGMCKAPLSTNDDEYAADTDTD